MSFVSLHINHFEMSINGAFSTWRRKEKWSAVEPFLTALKYLSVSKYCKVRPLKKLQTSVISRIPAETEWLAHALSSDHNPVVFKILSRPSVSKPSPILDYKHANWPLFRSTLDQLIVISPHISDRTDLEHTIQDFAAVRQAAHTAIPELTVRCHYLALPPSLVKLMKIKNYCRWRYQRSGFRPFHPPHQLISHVLTSRLSQPRNYNGPPFWAH